MSRLAQLKSATSRADVAELLEMSNRGISYALYSRNIAGRYTVFEVPKRRGGVRTIKAPDVVLKSIQRKLSDLLQDCVDEIEAARAKPDKILHGFKRRRSIITNAAGHRRRRWVFNVDLADFFASMNFGRVRGFFIKDKEFSLHPDVATVLAQIACDGVALPQGSPCSPVVSNLVGRILDRRLAHLVSKCRCVYTRYVDDLTFSTNRRDFPQEIAVLREDHQSKWEVGDELKALITSSGFTINSEKTRMQYRDSRQDVTGLVVNERVNVRCEYRHEVRAMVHRLITTGKFEIDGKSVVAGKLVSVRRQGALPELEGRLNFIRAIDEHNRVHAESFNRENSGRSVESLHRQFIVYRDFCVSQVPVVLCEGKTDIIYLKCAIQRLKEKVPLLVGRDGDAVVRLRVKLYKYVKSMAARVLGLGDGGTAALAGFIRSYPDITHAVPAERLLNPVIIVVDKDSGISPIVQAVKYVKKEKRQCHLGEPFVHVVKNIYIVPVPLVAGATSCSIEDLFDEKTRSIQIGDKRFSADDGADRSRYFGKSVFASEIIVKNIDTINFDGFVPLLRNISAVIQKYHPIVDPAQARG